MSLLSADEVPLPWKYAKALADPEFIRWLRAQERQAAEWALREAADPMRIMEWAEGPCARGLSVVAVNRYLVDRAEGVAAPATRVDA